MNIKKFPLNTKTDLLNLEGQNALDQHVVKVMAKVEKDLDEHLIDVNAADEEVMEKINEDINAYLKNVPSGMNIQQFLAYAFLFRCYESCLVMDKEKWELKLEGEEAEKRTQIETALNYYELFHLNTFPITQIAGFEDAGKIIRTLEVEITAQGKKSLYEWRKNTYEKYIESGDLAIALDMRFLGIEFNSRIPPPRETPKWLTDALNS